MKIQQFCTLLIAGFMLSTAAVTFSSCGGGGGDDKQKIAEIDQLAGHALRRGILEVYFKSSGEVVSNYPNNPWSETNPEGLIDKKGYFTTPKVSVGADGNEYAVSHVVFYDEDWHKNEMELTYTVDIHGKLKVVNVILLAAGSANYYDVTSDWGFDH